MHPFEAVYRRYLADFSGVCLIKRGDDVLFSAADGLANRDFDVPNRLSTRFDTASVTKVFTAVATLMLEDRGLLRLTDRIHDLIDLRDTAIAGNVTVEQLLNHTSGIADDADEESGEDYSALFTHKPNYAIRNSADFLPQFAHKPPVFEAGTAVRYNNCAFVLLGLAIEQLSGADYRSFVAREVFEKAGMRNTCFGAKDEVCPQTAEGYFPLRDEQGAFVKWMKNIYSYPPIGTPDSGALTTAGDLDVFIRALKGGALLSKKNTELIFTPHCSFTRPHRHGAWRTGYGFEFIETDGKACCMYKEGCNRGVDALLSYYPALDISLILLSNQEGPFWEMHREMQGALMDLYPKRS